jgi:Lon protease-like protein
MIQPRKPGDGGLLYDVGCIARIGEVEALEDGRYNLILEGEQRFRLIRELDVTTAFRQVEGDPIEEPEDQYLSSVERAGFEQEARLFADRQGLQRGLDSVARLDDQSLINGVSQIAPFDPAAKQALLEAPDLASRCELLVQLMQFFGLHDGGEDNKITLQ